VNFCVCAPRAHVVQTECARQWININSEESVKYDH